jgi:hypothetical protein
MIESILYFQRRPLEELNLMIQTSKGHNYGQQEATIPKSCN